MTREDTRLEVTIDGRRTSRRIQDDAVLQDSFAPALIGDVIRACRARRRSRCPVCALPGRPGPSSSAGGAVSWPRSTGEGGH